MNAFIELIKSYQPISEQELQQVLSALKYKAFAKNETLYSAGETCVSIYVMTKGLVRCFYIHDDKEVNLRLICENSIVTGYSSHITRSPSIETIQALEPCEGYMLSRDVLVQLEASIPAIAKISLHSAQMHYMSMERRLLTIQHKTAEEKIRYFQQHMEPSIIERTPAIHIASYLGMTPESYSRAKRNLTKC